MARAVAFVVVILIFALTFLLHTRAERRSKERREEHARAVELAAAAILALEEVDKEVDLQKTAQRPDLMYLQNILRLHLYDITKLQTTNRKEIRK